MLSSFTLLRNSSRAAFVSFILVVAASASGDGPTDPDVTARDAFWSASDLVDKPVPPRLKVFVRPKRQSVPKHDSKQSVQLVAADPLGLRYSILKRDADGTYREVAPETTFRDGDRVRISLMSNQKGYLYIIEQGSSGSWFPLLPEPGQQDSHELEAGHEYLFPEGDTLTFDHTAGTERLFILLTRKPETNISQTIAALKRVQGQTLQASNAISEKQLQSWRIPDGSRDLIRTPPSESEAVSDHADGASYVVNKVSEIADPHVEADLSLLHK